MRLHAIGICRVKDPDELVLAGQNAVVWHDIVMALNEPAALFIDVVRLSNTETVDVCDPTARGPDPSRYARPVSPWVVGLDASIAKPAKENSKAQTKPPGALLKLDCEIPR
jgi:hypothetical protein